MVGIGIDSSYSVYRMRTLRLHPEYTGDAYTWTLCRPDGTDSVVCTGRDYYFVAPAAGDYHFRLHIASATDPVEHEFTIRAWDEDVVYSRYIAAVHEFRPAPGQFVNELPPYEDGDTEKDMCRKVLECIGGRNDVLISLGSYGGYVTFSFDHTVANYPGQYDFRIDGNAFYADSGSGGGTSGEGGSSEPGIVMVALDTNGNGIPDDPWYELAGSEYYKDTTAKNFSVTYRHPTADHTPVPGDATITDSRYIGYDCSDGTSGWISRIVYHGQDYWPGWIAGDELTFTGTCLPPNAVDESGQGSYYVQHALPWGYADNQPNNYLDRTSFDIGWAVDAEGRPVHLGGADFIRVYTGMLQQCGWLGETSTEIARAEDLHIAE